MRKEQAQTVRQLVEAACRAAGGRVTRLHMIAVNLASERPGFWEDGRECILHLETALTMVKAANRGVELEHA